MLPNAPALNELVMFVLQAGIAVATLVWHITAGSNHIIITLDILYLLSLSMLVLYHMLKEADSLHSIFCFSINRMK
jgi:uncharacterized membrane protein